MTPGFADRDSRYIPTAVKEAVRARDGGKCTRCGSAEDLQFDHVFPWSKGGTSKDPANIQLLCKSCNQRKRDMVHGSGKNRLGNAETELKPDSLVGSYFHGDVNHRWQGCVVAEPSPGVYLVELFSWISGGSTSQQLVRLEDMTGWNFYDDAEWMNSSYEAGRYPWVKAERDEERAYREMANSP